MIGIKEEEFFTLMEQDGYTAEELNHLFCVIRDMDPRVHSWVSGWLKGNGYPEDRIEGVTVEELVEHQGLKPLNAFIVMDWLLKDPDGAKYSLTRPQTELLIDEAVVAEIVRAAGRMDADESASEEGGPIEDITGE